MGFKSYRPPMPKVTDGTDLAKQEARKISRKVLVPRMIKKAKNAIETDPKYFYYFQRKLAGRRCSCWSAETTPSGDCKICWGTGTVGGFNKWGTYSHTIDWTHPRLNLVGLVPNFLLEGDTRPVYLSLDEGVLLGYAETEIDVMNNTQMVDLIQLLYSGVTAKSSVKGYIKTDIDGRWVILNENNLSIRLARKKIKVRVEISRDYPELESPLFCNLFLRYNLRKEIRIMADIPKYTESITLSEFGIYDVFSSLTMFIDNTLQNITTYDFFKRLDDGIRWRVQEVQPFKPEGILTNSDLTCRVIQEYEPEFRVP
jgi:hypothetical protein